MRYVFAGALLLVPAHGQEAAALYRDQIRPLLEKHCLACHSTKTRQGGLDLSSREGLLKGSVHGPVVAPGDAESSQLYKLVAHIVEPGMPFKGKKLGEEAIGRIAEWIKAGAWYGEPETDAEAVDVTKAREHWAFRVPQKAPLPKVKEPGRVRNAVDHFIEAGLESRGLKPIEEADKRTLLRRVYVDLTGMAPSAGEMKAFLDDRSPDAYEKVVDRLLASAEHAERWARHWLDIWRYSDWYGYRRTNEVRYSQRHIWRWRDWTVDAIRENKPYDRMIVEMLAGDEVASADPEVARATGYLARNWYKFNRNVWLQDAVEYTAASFLGLTLKCARCHSHKYDPIPHGDYYRFRAFFEPHEVRTDRVPGEADAIKDGLARVYDADPGRPTYRFFRGNESNPDVANPLAPGVPQLFGGAPLKIEPVALPREAYFPDGRAFVPGDLMAQARAEVEKMEAVLVKARSKPEAGPVIEAAEKRVEAARADVIAVDARIRAEVAAMSEPPAADAEPLAERARELERKANMLRAGAEITLGHYEFEQAKGEEKKLAAATRKLEAAVKALNEPKEGYTPIGPRYPVTSSGRRLALARWIASPGNPLTARVAVNHMWLRHFGKALAPTVFNFGRSGKKPSHPELLDWLAAEFAGRGWDMRAMHRLMVTSAAYRRRSSGWSSEEANVKADPDNVYLWRMQPRRMEAEAVRDSILKIAGKLDPAMGGPEIDESKGHEIYRRSIYFRTAPDLQMDMLKAFDQASPNECFERGESIVPQQALALANGKLSLEMARVIAARIAGEGGDFVSAAFEWTLGSPATEAEARESVEYLRTQGELYQDGTRLSAFATGAAAGVKPSAEAAQRARESLVHVLLNHNEFVTVR